MIDIQIVGWYGVEGDNGFRVNRRERDANLALMCFVNVFFVGVFGLCLHCEAVGESVNSFSEKKMEAGWQKKSLCFTFLCFFRSDIITALLPFGRKEDCDRYRFAWVTDE